MSFISIIGTAICAFALTAAVKQFNPAMAVYVSSAAALILTVFALGYYKPLIAFIKNFSDGSGIASYAGIMIKLVAIGAITGIAADICSDAGELTIASKIELLGKGAAAVTVLPVLENLIGTVEKFLM